MYPIDMVARGMNSTIQAELLVSGQPSDYTTANFTYNGSSQLTQIIWRDVSNNIIRTDTFTYSSDSTTNTTIETRTPATGGAVIITSVFDLDGNIISITKT